MNTWMNARIIKETRSLLPVFGVMLLTAVVPPLIWRRDIASGVGFMVFLACCAMLGACSLGNEFQWRTLPLLLSQPVPRRRLWLEKMLVLGSAVALGCLAFLACTFVPDFGNGSADRWLVALVPLVGLCSAPYLTLVFKNTVGAAAVTVILPIGCAVSLGALEQGLTHYIPQAGEWLDKSLELHPLAYPATGALIYSLTFGWLGYRKFIGLQVIDSQAQDITLPPRMEAALAGPLRRFLPGYTGPWASLFRKELRLQRASFILAGLMLALVPLQLLAWTLFHSEIAVGSLWVNFAVCVFIIPLVATGMSVAEERNLGVANWQFIQPVSARKQWAVKIVVVLLVCVTLGLLLPAAGVVVAKGYFDPKGLQLPQVNTTEDAIYLFLIAPLLYLLLLNLGVFTSSVSTTTFQAVIKTIAIILLGFAGMALIINVCSNIEQNHWIRSPIFSLPKIQTQELGKLQALWAHQRQMTGIYVMAPGSALLALLAGVSHLLAYVNYRKGEQAARFGWIKSGAFLMFAGGLLFALRLAVAFINIAQLSAGTKSLIDAAKGG